jgi:hypothetical protein
MPYASDAVTRPIALQVLETLLNCFQAALKSPNLRRDLGHSRGNESASRRLSKELLHCWPEHGVHGQEPGSVTWIASTAKRGIKYLERDHLGGMAMVVVLEIGMLPPVDLAYVVDVQANRRGTGNNAAVSPNEVLLRATLNASGDTDVGDPCARSLASIHRVDAGNLGDLLQG